MSADNWAQCPRCAANRQAAVRDLIAKAAQAYGVLPISEFDKLRQSAVDLECESLNSTYRENYEISGAEDGEVVVSYRGSCARCGLSLKFEDTHPLDVIA